MTGIRDETSAELTELQQAFRARRDQEAGRFRAATDSEFWFAVCFESRAEKEAFLRAAGLFECGDKYLDGRAVAERLGIETGGE